MVASCKGRVMPLVSEAQTNDTLRYLQGLFNAEKYKNEQKKGKENVQNQQAIPHEEMLMWVKESVDSMLNRSKYNNVDLG